MKPALSDKTISELLAPREMQRLVSIVWIIWDKGFDVLAVQREPNRVKVDVRLSNGAERTVTI